jgi:hypothetical protein
MRVQPIEKSVWPGKVERNHTLMRWQQVAAFTPKGAGRSDPAHGKFTEDEH